MKRLVALMIGAVSLGAVAQNFSLQFNGESDFVHIPHTLLYEEEFTIAFWVLPELPATTTTMVQQIFFNGRSEFTSHSIEPDSYSLLLDLQSDGGYYTSVNGDESGPGSLLTQDAIDFDSWNHIAITYSEGTLSHFTNGEMTASMDYSIQVQNDFETTLGIGLGSSELNFFDGKLDELSIWEVALDEAEIEAVINCPLTGSESGLRAYWGFGEGTGSTVSDLPDGNNIGYLDGDLWSTDTPPVNCPVMGCMNVDACNFDEAANIDNGSCVFPPAIELGDDIETCEEFVTLNAGAGFDNYLWSTGETTQTIQVHESGLFSVDAFVNAAPPAGDGSLSFDGLDDWVEVETNSGLDVGDANFTIGLEAKFETPNAEVALFDYYIDDNSARINLRRMPSGEIILYINDNLDHELSRFSSSPVPIQSWLQIVATFDRETSDIDLYINGELQNGAYQKSDDITAPIDPSGILQFGKYGDGQQDGYFHGKMSSAAFWHRRLSHQEIENFEYCSTVDLDDETLVGFWGFGNGATAEISDLTNGNNQAFINGAIYSSDNPGSCNNCSESDSISVEFMSSGCIDDYACNYDTTAECGDGSCDYSCCPGPGCCGEGMFWDWNLEECAITNPSDSNFDGCVQLNDLLDLLSAYGDCGSEESAWQCGEQLEYQGYIYNTTLIGDQCWFGENLRNANYANGDAIPSSLSVSEWVSTSFGAVAVYGEVSPCQDYNPDIDACDPAQSLERYGRLYNWHAVEDSRGLCPNGWHVPTDGEWTLMTEFLGGDSVAGGQMKTTYGWSSDGNGTNSSGFAGLPGGFRDINGVYNLSGITGFWWSSSPMPPDAWLRNIDFDEDIVFRGANLPTNGFSVRCIKDSE